MLIQAYLLAKLVPGVAVDLARYPFRGEAGAKSWEAMLRLHCMTNGRSTAIARRVMQWLKPPPTATRPFDSMLGHFDAASMQEIADQIRRDGYYVFPTRLADDFCDEIAAAADAAKSWNWRKGLALIPAPDFDPDHPLAHRYEMGERDVWRIPAYQRIIGDPIFVNLSQTYFGAAPALKEVSLWWSPAIGDGKPDDDAAQTFHFDFDAAPIWLKFFVYLSDVTPRTGPHIFIRGSHRLREKKMKSLIARGYVRVGDDEIEQRFGAENAIELIGPKGTVFVADTLGFHKGKAPHEGHRLMAQLEFATSPFVPVTSRPLAMPADIEPSLAAARQAYPGAFARFPPR
jgi:hypothetical protein